MSHKVKNKWSQMAATAANSHDHAHILEIFEKKLTSFANTFERNEERAAQTEARQNVAERVRAVLEPILNLIKNHVAGVPFEKAQIDNVKASEEVKPDHKYKTLKPSP